MSSFVAHIASTQIGRCANTLNASTSTGGNAGGVPRAAVCWGYSNGIRRRHLDLSVSIATKFGDAGFSHILINVKYKNMKLKISCIIFDYQISLVL